MDQTVLNLSQRFDVISSNGAHLATFSFSGFIRNEKKRKQVVNRLKMPFHIESTSIHCGHLSEMRTFNTFCGNSDDGGG